MGNRLHPQTVAFYLTVAAGCLLPVLLARKAIVLVPVLLLSVGLLLRLKEARRKVPVLVPVFVGTSCVAQLLNLFTPVIPVVCAVIALLPVAVHVKESVHDRA